MLHLDELGDIDRHMLGQPSRPHGVDRPADTVSSYVRRSIGTSRKFARIFAIRRIDCVRGIRYDPFQYALRYDLGDSTVISMILMSNISDQWSM